MLLYFAIPTFFMFTILSSICFYKRLFERHKSNLNFINPIVKIGLIQWAFYAKLVFINVHLFVPEDSLFIWLLVCAWTLHRPWLRPGRDQLFWWEQVHLRNCQHKPRRFMDRDFWKCNNGLFLFNSDGLGLHSKITA